MCGEGYCAVGAAADAGDCVRRPPPLLFFTWYEWAKHNPVAWPGLGRCTGQTGPWTRPTCVTVMSACWRGSLSLGAGADSYGPRVRFLIWPPLRPTRLSRELEEVDAQPTHPS